MKILVIDDDEIQHELLAPVFQQIGAVGIYCTTGEAGLTHLAKHYFDCVLLDLGLPGKNGIHVLRTMRDNQLWRDIAVIVFTATKTRESLQQCMRLGISDYIGKPYSLPVIAQKLELLRQALSLRKASLGKPGAAIVTVDRLGSVTRITFGGVFNDESVRKFLTVYNTQFRTQTKNDSILLNLAALPDLSEPQVRMFKLITDAIAPKLPLIVAGRSYGPLVAVLSDLDAQLYLVEEDALEFLRAKA